MIIVIRPDGTYDLAEATEVMRGIRTLVGTNRLDVITMGALDFWTADTSDEWEQRWSTGPTPQPNVLATQLLVHMYPGHRRALFGTVVITANTMNYYDGTVDAINLSSDQLTIIRSLLKMYTKVSET